MLISLAFFGSTTINTSASEDDQNYCIVNNEGETVCFDEEGKPISTYEHNNCPH